MKTSDTGIWLAAVMLGVIVMLLRALYLYAPRRWHPRGRFAQALRFARMHQRQRISNTEFARCMQRPVRVVHQAAGQCDEISRSLLQQVLGMLRLADHAHRHSRQTAGAADFTGIASLESGHAGHRRQSAVTADAAGRTIDGVDAAFLQCL